MVVFWLQMSYGCCLSLGVAAWKRNTMFNLDLTRENQDKQKLSTLSELFFASVFHLILLPAL